MVDVSPRNVTWRLEAKPVFRNQNYYLEQLYLPNRRLTIRNECDVVFLLGFHFQFHKLFYYHPKRLSSSYQLVLAST